MRIYGSVQVSFWANPEIQGLSDQGKLLAIYLLTGPHSNMMGCYRLPSGYITEDLQWDGQAVKKAFQELVTVNYLTRDEASGWLYIHDFLKWNPIQNPRQGIGIQKIFYVIPVQSKVFKPLIKGLLNYGKYLDKEFVDRLQDLNQTEVILSEDCVADKEQNKDKNQDQEQNQKRKSLSGKPDAHPLDDHFLKEKNKSSPKVHAYHLEKQALEILQFLNEKTGRVYRPEDANLKLIMACLATGASVMDCRQVIAKKTREWKGNEKMDRCLRPATLFDKEKFAQYIGELVPSKEEEVTYG